MKKSAVFRPWACLSTALLVTFLLIPIRVTGAGSFEGTYFKGKGDTEYLELLDIMRRMLEPDPEFQNIPMLYNPLWNGFVEGPKWGAWWIQNSYGPTYCALPFYGEPYITFLENSHDLWFDRMGDGKKEFVFERSWAKDSYRWIPPDGCLMDAAAPGFVVHKQGDGRVDIHDWGMEFTAAGFLMQSELLLIGRDPEAIAEYLPKLERCAGFIESRRDTANNLFLAGPAANLLAPSYAGWHKADGSYDKAYLTGLSVTYIAALDRLIELEKLAGREDKAELYAERRQAARNGLTLLVTDEGYFIKSMDPDGTRHGVFGAGRHGYFEAVVNHDAIAFRVAGDEQANKIYIKIQSIPGLRPHGVIITNYPGLDDLYEPEEGIWRFGTWVNGGHWTTCEARMIMAYYRLGKYEDVRRSVKHLLSFARTFRQDNPLTEFGGNVWFKDDPINLCYDNFGAPAAMIRGLFEYLYGAEGLTVIPHIPPEITELSQRFPVRFGGKKLYLSVSGTGPVTAVTVNSMQWDSFDDESVFLAYDHTPETAAVVIMRGKSEAAYSLPVNEKAVMLQAPPPDVPAKLDTIRTRAEKLETLYNRLKDSGLAGSYEAAHARLAVEFTNTIYERIMKIRKGTIELLPEPSQTAADSSYLAAAVRICDGIENVLESYRESGSDDKRQIYRMWLKSKQ